LLARLVDWQIKDGPKEKYARMRQRDRKTDRQKDRKTERQIDRKTERYAYIPIDLKSIDRFTIYRNIYPCYELLNGNVILQLVRY
jgi:hypothetical protein